MDRLTYLKGERSAARKELKNYLVMFRDEISQECGVEFPTQKELKQFTSEEFDNWFNSISNQLQEKESDDLVLIELIELYICSINNVSSAEATNTNDMYF